MHLEELQDALTVMVQSIFIFYLSPIYDKYKGIYICPGYKEGDTFIKC